MSTKYLDYEGLKVYTEQMKRWVLAQINASTPEIDEKYDDVKVYSSISEFPRPGVEDVTYIAQDTGYQYVWNGSDYEVLAEAINTEAIEDLLQS